jgi:hypothetical protein
MDRETVRNSPMRETGSQKAMRAVDQLGNRYRESPTDAGSSPAAFDNHEARRGRIPAGISVVKGFRRITRQVFGTDYRRKKMDAIALARFLNQISQTETHFDDMSKKVQSIYERRAMQIMLFMMENCFGSECTNQERLDYFSAGFCSGYKAGGVEEYWIDEAFCDYEKKRQEKSAGAKNTEQLLQPKGQAVRD